LGWRTGDEFGETIKGPKEHTKVKEPESPSAGERGVERGAERGESGATTGEAETGPEAWPKAELE